jgi:hypothetical protein
MLFRAVFSVFIPVAMVCETFFRDSVSTIKEKLNALKEKTRRVECLRLRDADFF